MRMKPQLPNELELLGESWDIWLKYLKIYGKK